MALTSSEHRAVVEETRHRRNMAAVERRATGLAYRKAAAPVVIVSAELPTGDTVLLATANRPAEDGRWFQLRRQADGRLTCSCAMFRNAGRCEHVDAAAAREDGGE